MYVYPQCETDLGQRSEVGSWSEEFRTVQYITCIHDYERKVKQENVRDNQQILNSIHRTYSCFIMFMKFYSVP